MLSNYSSFSFRQDGLKELADKGMHSSLTQGIVQYNFWDLPVDPSESFLGKPLQTNNLSKDNQGIVLSL